MNFPSFVLQQDINERSLSVAFDLKNYCGIRNYEDAYKTDGKFYRGGAVSIAQRFSFSIWSRCVLQENKKLFTIPGSAAQNGTILPLIETGRGNLVTHQEMLIQFSLYYLTDWALGTWQPSRLKWEVGLTWLWSGRSRSCFFLLGSSFEATLGVFRISSLVYIFIHISARPEAQRFFFLENGTFFFAARIFLGLGSYHTSCAR